MIRHSLQYASWRNRKPLAKALKAIYGASSAEVAAAEVDRFEAGPLGSTVRRGGAELAPALGGGDPVFRLLPAGPQILYTTNFIESLHSLVRKAIRNKGHFPSDEAATKLIYLALRNITTKWRRPPKE